VYQTFRDRKLIQNHESHAIVEQRGETMTSQAIEQLPRLVAFARQISIAPRARVVD
jgi:hypothetical protein